MKEPGSRIYGDEAERGSASLAHRRVGACLAFAALALLGACASDGDAPAPPPKTQAQKDLKASSETLSKPLLADTEQEGTVIGALAGGLFSIGGGRDRAGISIPVGAVLGNLAGKYVAAKQEEFSEEVEVVEAMTRDIKGKNKEARRTIAAMEIVVAEHRARLAELRKAGAKDRGAERRMEQRIAVAEADLKTMKSAVEKAEGHLKTFTKAREIVVKDSDTRGFAEKPVVKTMDGEIAALRARIQSMNELVNDLTSVS